MIHKQPIPTLLVLVALSLLIIIAGSNALAHPHGAHGHSHAPTDYTTHDHGPEYIAPIPDEAGFYWWKGNLHTHTLWSDGDQYPEVVVDWYKQHGYHFLSLSDHNILSQGQKWINPETSRFAQSSGGLKGFEYYREQFGDEWVETRTNGDDELEVRLKPLNEFRTLFEEPGRFLMIQGEEITDHLAVHVNATNLIHYIPPQGGDTVQETIERNFEAVLEQQEETGQAMLPHLNHPNFQWAVAAEDMIPVENLQFFEVYNGHRSVFNFGNDVHIDLDRMWDIVLSMRLGELNLETVYALAVDDSHNYDDSLTETALPGRGWVMVRTRFLTPEHLIAAMEAGDFYASTGVTLSSITTSDDGLSITIEPEEGITYTTKFIGTRKGFDPSSEPVLDNEGNPVKITKRYSDEIGVVLKEVEGTSASYTLEGDELYVRALVVSSKPKENYFAHGELEMAWVQPIVPQN